MSAYMIHEDHAHALITAYLELRAPRSSTSADVQSEATAMVRTLLTECEASVRYRYPTGTLPGPVERTPIDETTFVAVAWSTPFATYRDRTLARTINAARCYAYQACEHPGWPESAARRIVDDLVEMAASALARRHDSTWGVMGRDHFTAKPESM